MIEQGSMQQIAIRNTLQLAATYRNTLQHIAAHCKALQHTGQVRTLELRHLSQSAQNLNGEIRAPRLRCDKASICAESGGTLQVPW